MKPTAKIRVAVLYGGRSAEHEVSLRSATNVINNLDPSHFEVIPIGIDKQGKWFLGKDVFANSLEQNSVAHLPGDGHAWFAPEWIGNPAQGQNIKDLILSQKNSGPHFDVVFPVVHGTLCEDGTLQGLLEIAGLPYVGCGVLASAIGMDKDVAKRLAYHAGIPVAPYLVILKSIWQNNRNEFPGKIAETLSYPVFVKPANAGSSIGISKVKTPDQLQAAVDEAFRFDTKVLVEKALTVMELEVAVLESLDQVDPIISVIGEIRPSHEFYSYDAKYIDENGAELIIPAPINSSLQEQARSMAKKIFQTLECEGMARIDLFLNKDDNKIYFNEINTIPGFTQISMYPKLMDASGISYSALLTHLIQLAIKRHKHKSELIRSYT